MSGTAPGRALRPFTRRQHEVLTLLVNGMRNREIAQRLGVSEADVKAIIARMLHRLGVTSRSALAAVGAAIDLTGLDVAPLRASWRLLRDTPFYVAVLAGPEHRFALANERFARRAGKPLLGRTVAQVFPNSVVTELVERAYRSGETLNERGFLARWRSADGVAHEATFDVVFHPLRDDSGAITAVAVFALEAPLAKSTIAVSASERELLEAIPAGVAVIAPDRRIVAANAAAFRALDGRILPHTLDDLYAWRSFHDPWSGRAFKPDELPSARALRGIECPPQLFDVLFPNGRHKLLLISAMPLNAADGGVRGAMIVLASYPEH